MTRLLVVGLGPLLAPGTRYLGGQCLRTWQFTRPLIAAGHVVTLVTCPVDAALPAENVSRVGDGVEMLEYEGFAYQAFRHRSMRDQVWHLQNLLRDEPFEAIVAVNTYAAELVGHLATTLPVWADLNGWIMAEAQARAAWRQCDDDLRWNWRQEHTVAWRADRFSTVSRAQRAALLGELAAIGRLDSANFGTELVVPVPNAAAPPHLAIGRTRLEAGQPLATPKGTWVPPGAPVVLLAGGFNYWTDPAALLRALEAALHAYPAAHAVVTGGAIKGFGEEVFERFSQATAQSPVRERIQLLGWLPTDDMLAWFGAATVGLSFDTPSLEAEFGARNRLTNMAASALAAVATRGPEVATDLEQHRAGWWVNAGDADALAQNLIAALSDPAEAFARGRRAFDMASSLYHDATTVAAMVQWAAEPTHAPDHARRIERLTAKSTDGQRPAIPPHHWYSEPLHSMHEYESMRPGEDLGVIRHEARCYHLLRNKWPLRLLRRLARRR